MPNYIDIDKAAHAIFNFKPQKNNAEYQGGRFLVNYHEERLYSVRDTKLQTVKLIRAGSPFEAATRVFGAAMTAAEPKNGLWVSDSEYAAYLKQNASVTMGHVSSATMNEIAFNLHVIAACQAEQAGHGPAKWEKEHKEEKEETTFEPGDYVELSDGEAVIWNCEKCGAIVRDDFTDSATPPAFPFCPYCGRKVRSDNANQP